MRAILLLVGFLDRVTKLFNYQPGAGFEPAQFLASPFLNGNNLDPVIFPATAGSQVTMQAALQVPPVAKATLLYGTVMASLRVKVTDDVTGADVTDQYRWLNWSGTAETPAHRWAGCQQDMMFFREGVIFVGRDADGKIYDGIKLPRNMWSLDALGRVMINGTVYPNQSELIYFKSLLPQGFLEYGAENIAHYHDLVSTIRSRGRNPIPLLELHVTEDYEPPIGDNESRELKKTAEDWATARRSPEGAVAITPRGIQLIAHQPNNSDAEMLTGARNAVRLDSANFLNINAAMLDGNNGTSDTYSNTLQNQNEFTSLSMSTWTRPLEARLSMDDVTAPGHSVSFGVNTFDQSTIQSNPVGNTGTATEPVKEMNP